MKKVDEESGGVNASNDIAHYLEELRAKREKKIPTLMSGMYCANI